MNFKNMDLRSTYNKIAEDWFKDHHQDTWWQEGTEKFLEALGGTDVSPELIARLRKTLLDDKTFTERALKTAVLGEESLP